ncbi:unnamed protein product [Phytomonas sp. Hart1]|nr:unnamed protein product [Phytomonas sp. Hart1]|eukprot:CCW69791.1 unnamed protein product [Phytomonas sp. isolate Hart1]
MAGVLRRLKPASREWLALGPTLLWGGLSMVEVAATTTDVMIRCQLIGLALVVFKAWQAITEDPRTAPHCALEVLDQLRAEVFEKANAGEQAAAIEEILEEIEERYDAAGEAPCVDFDPAELANFPPYIGYVGRWLWSMAAVDQLYEHRKQQLQHLSNDIRPCLNNFD